MYPGAASPRGVRSRVIALILALTSGECRFPSLLLGRALAAALILARASALIFLPFIGGVKVARRFNHAFLTISLRLKGATVMGNSTKIEWCDMTFNPWIGCTKVSPACDFCYAENLMDTRYGRARWGAGEDRVRTSAGNWSQPRRWNKAAQGLAERPFVFCASLADVFDNEVDELWRNDLFAVIEDTPNLVWLLLTKRIGNVLKMTDPARGNRCLPPNAAIGATLPNQEEYDRDRMKLWEVKQRREPLFTFGSFEPLLGPVILDSYAPDWIIVGGESGSNARTMNLDWARSLKRQATELGRVFNFKQVGGRTADKGGHALDGATYFARPSIAQTPTEQSK
jgi:protein gp37